jgi:hypothetical protein
VVAIAQAYLDSWRVEEKTADPSRIGRFALAGKRRGYGSVATRRQQAQFHAMGFRRAEVGEQ